MKILAAFLFVTTCLLPSASYAVDTPRYVIKVDTQAPSIIFARGYISDGHDRDLIHYIESTQGRTVFSAYIATVAEPPDLNPLFEAMAEANPDQTMYLYRIRPTDNFYSLEMSLIFARDALPEGDARRRLNDYWLATREWAPYTWLASAAITANQISGAYPFRMENGVLRFGRYIPNPNYYYALPELSNRIIPARNETVENVVVAENQHGLGFIPGAIVPDGCNAQPRRLRASASTSCLPLLNLPINELRLKTVAKIVTAGLLTGVSSGQLWSVLGHDEL